jgi:hypothetical protein
MKLKSPLVSVKTSDSLVPRVSLVSDTAAPGITPPCGSLTVPVTVPVTCADALPANAQSARTAAASARTLNTNIAVPPPNCDRRRLYRRKPSI